MGKATGFLEYSRQDNGDIPPQRRIQTFEEFHEPLQEEPRRKQAARCMNCGVPFCQSAMTLAGMVTGCPLHNLIPEWNHEIYEGHDEHALSRLCKTASFPEFTGRVCPALCEKACMCGQYDEPVSIRDNELYLIETAFAQGTMCPRIPKVRSGKKVAVIGSGPSGLAAADLLNRRGHLVTVYERDDRIGGLLMYGIPNMKLDKEVIMRRQRLMEAEGVTFVTGFDVDSPEKAQNLKTQYDAVVLCCGAKQPRTLTGAVTDLHGEKCDLRPDQVKGVFFAVDFLKSTTKALLGGKGRSVQDLHRKHGYISAAGKHVVIVGGGDTGNDCIGTVIRHGCRSVTALEMLGAPPVNRAQSNPWPQWPKILKTDYGHEEAAYLYGKDPRIFETTVKEFITGKRGELRKIRTVKVAFEGRTMHEVEGTEQVLPCDLLLIAAGFTGCQEYTPSAFGLERGARGTVLCEGHKTAVPGIFAAGDMRRGQSLVVWAIAEGRTCAAEVDEYLMGYSML